MTIQFGTTKDKCWMDCVDIFFARPEIRTLVIVINVFAILSAILFFLKKIQGPSPSSSSPCSGSVSGSRSAAPAA